MENSNWIKLHRVVLDNEIFRNDRTAWHVFEVLILAADHRNGMWSGGRKQLAYLCNINENTLKSALNRLKKCKMVTQDSNTKYSVIHICNWSKYQVGVEDAVTQTTPKRHPIDTTLTRIRNRNNIYSQKETELLTTLNEKTNRNFRVLPNGTKTLLKQFTLDEISTALDNLAKDSWHAEKLPTLSSSYLLRQTTIDKFLTSSQTKSWFAQAMESENGTL